MVLAGISNWGRWLSRYGYTSAIICFSDLTHLPVHLLIKQLTSIKVNRHRSYTKLSHLLCTDFNNSHTFHQRSVKLRDNKKGKEYSLLQQVGNT